MISIKHRAKALGNSASKLFAEMERAGFIRDDLKKFFENLAFKFKEEKIIFILVLSILIITPAIIAGPEISGKNILRLSSLTIIFFTYLTYLFVGKLKLSWSFNLVFFLIVFIFLQHPTYSKSKLFEIFLN